MQTVRKYRGTLLLLDIDSRKRYDSRWIPKCGLPYQKLAGRLRVFRGSLNVEGVSYNPTRRGWHVIVHIAERLSPSEIIAVQACLGSDIKREIMNLQRYFGFRGKKVPRFWKDRWNLLFSRKV